MSFTNPNPNLHIDLLKSQYVVFSVVLKRMINEHNDTCYALGKEISILKDFIKQKEDENKINRHIRPYRKW